ncbi:hypothetical protein [Deinococcus sp. S9]|uniref:hypothetical protein n=1 Tax=Deinococcus sp. S9 TaxID=2545754 RepID=UPI00105506E8|nr:hypothetical protein [Deinococcus sp. S9]TDE85322.1 hypothetical protein E0686_12370 [Deinococcus sp. S9]
MKKLLALISLLSFAQANAQTWRDLLFPSEQQVMQTCSVATRIESMPRTTEAQKTDYDTQRSAARLGKFLNDYRSMTADPVAKLQAMVDSVRLQFPTGSAYVICGKAAGELKAPPTYSQLPNIMLVYIGARAKERNIAEGYNAVLAFYDAGENELTRLQPSRARKGDISDWRPSCTSGTCKWVGENTYYFTPTPELNKVLDKVASMKLIFTRGQGIEERRYTLEDFKKPSLIDPKN